ncbi:synaptic vesicle 2-related protein-like isoform X1 [Galleria mellonella]|uniref:Synaptic vesicle 2-related protein-like isoform X1 n=1 Tax=Galleria mellonella TaxID=7137 RepID=A0ABM3MDN8_GALME|nr:synaptic vesicle 2-related protein-like isoform X1 [Galleria mellonella]
MAAVNESYDKTGDLDDIEMNSMGAARKKEDIGRYSYEEALDLTGHGKYNLGLLMACFMVITAMGIDIFGLGIIVTAATCDLGMGLAEIGVLSSMPFAGIIVMSYPWGYLSDTRGRKLVLMWAMCGSFLSSVFSSFAPNWQMLAAFRFISSALSSAAESATYALLGECCAARLRARYMLLVTSALMITPTIYYVWGYLIMKLDFSFQFLAIVYRPWRLLTQVMALPLGLGALMLYFYSESPKFLANVGRNEESIDVLKRIYVKNGGDEKDFPVKEIYLLDGSTEEVGEFSLRSLWTQIAPLFKPPLLTRTILLYYLTFVIYIANNSFAIILPTIFNVFFTSYATSAADASFCDLFALSNSTTVDETETQVQDASVCTDTINDLTILAGCVHGLSFFVLNALISQCAHKRKAMTIVIMVIAAAAAVGLNNLQQPIAGLALFYVYLTTAMVFGVVSSYFVDLFPTSYRGMVACVGMMVARLSAFFGTNIVSRAMTDHCHETMYGAAGLVISGAVAASFLPADTNVFPN